MLPTLIQRLLTPAAYRHPVGSLQLIQTHISWIVLTGDYVYKLKKPIRTGFLDYSDLEKRRHFCHQEVALNCRFAPQLYLGVVAVVGSPQQAVVAAQTLQPGAPPPGETLEFAVRMRQFAADALLSQRLEEDRLTPQEVDQFAGQVACFHAAAERVDRATRWGTPSQIFDDTIANLDALRNEGVAAWPSPPQRHADPPTHAPSRHSPSTTDTNVRVHGDNRRQLKDLRHWTEQAFADLSDVLQQRRDAGWVRACHGDLHLSNVIEWQGQIIPFDGIEFSESLRWIDVISDIAFTAMDFHTRQHAAYAHRFLNAYLEATQDYAGLQVLRFYWVYRALVRAKVAAIQASQADDASNDLRHQQRKCLDLIASAVDYTRPEPPMILITHGVSGSGKTSGSQSVLEQRGAIRLRSDVIRKRMFAGDAESTQPGRSEDGIYSAAHTRQVYQRLAELAETTVRSGYTAVVDATFLWRWQRDAFYDLAARLSVPLQVLSFSADPQTLVQRIRQRNASGGDASDADEAVLRHQLATAQPLAEDERPRLVGADPHQQHRP